MLHHLDESLELFLRTCVPLGVRDIDVSFEAPDRTWAATINRPTVSAYLYDVQRSAARAVAGQETITRDDGTVVRRPAPTFVECRYLLTVWTSERRDEHQLLGALLRTLVTHRELPAEWCTGSIAELQPRPRLHLASAEQRDQPHAQLWPALEGTLHPALDLVVTIPVVPAVEAPAGPPVEGVLLATSPPSGSGPPAAGVRRMVAGATDPPAPGARVRSPAGSTTANAAGVFLVAAVEGDEVVLDDEPSRTATVPAAGGIVL